MDCKKGIPILSRVGNFGIRKESHRIPSIPSLKRLLWMEKSSFRKICIWPFPAGHITPQPHLPHSFFSFTLKQSKPETGKTIFHLGT